MCEVRRLGVGDAADIIDVVLDSFADYPVVRWVLGPAAGDPEALATLIGFFCRAKILRGEPMFGVHDDEGLAGVALMLTPDTTANEEAVRPLREATWASLGSVARGRYAAYAKATSDFEVDVPHLHLSILAVHGRARGRGLATPLMGAVHDLSVAHPESEGVTLTTESERNVTLYQRFGYRIVGEAPVSGGLYSWGFYRPDPR